MCKKGFHFLPLIYAQGCRNTLERVKLENGNVGPQHYILHDNHQGQRLASDHQEAGEDVADAHLEALLVGSGRG